MTDMKNNLATIGDYYPLSYDMAEAKGLEMANPLITGLGAEELLTWAGENRLTELQILTLLIKNAFEGHVCHLKGFSMEKLIERGTFQVDPGGEIVYRELASEFLLNLHLYQKGLEIAWKRVVVMNPDSAGIDFQTLLCFILANQLFRLPLSFLKPYESQKFRIISAGQRNQFRLHYMLYTSMLTHVAHRSFIEMVNEKYSEKFKDVLLRLQSKENVLVQLLTKLDFASDPSIKTEGELEKKYFDFLVASSVSKVEKKGLMLNPELTELAEDRNFGQVLKSRIKKLYKIISKNCSEVHIHTEGQDGYPQLRQYFIVATDVYNNVASDFSSLMLQHSNLILLFIKVINSRIINHLPVLFTDFTGMTEKQLAELKEEDVVNCQDSLQINMDMQQIVHFTDFKLKYVKDEEMADIHRDFLQRQFQFIEQRIFEVMKEIKLVMQNKTKVTQSL
jgi:hypothetical protein